MKIGLGFCLIKVEIRAVPCDLTMTSMKRLNVGEETFGGHPTPVLTTSYDITTKERMCLHAITFMKVVIPHPPHSSGRNSSFLPFFLPFLLSLGEVIL